MSIEVPAAERRTTRRERKAPERLGQQKVSKNGKSTTAADEDDDELEDELDEDDDDEDDFKAPASKKAKTGTGKQTPPAKRATKKGASGSTGQKKKAASKKAGGEKGADAADAIDDDNAIFNAVKDGDSSLETVAEDWIAEYQTAPGPAMADLVNFVLKCCACNLAVDEHEAVDDEGIVDCLERIQNEFKNSETASYPLVAKSKAYKKFRSSLTGFIAALLAAAASSDELYQDNDFVTLLQAWLSTLSSSKVRSFRHTATVVSLAMVTSLSELLVGVAKDFSGATRAKEAEEKKARKDKARLKALGDQVIENHGHKVKLEEQLKEIFDTVFVHRYRDAEAVIRTECVKALGGWMKVNPDYWLKGEYLRYIGWMFSDDSKEVRVEAVRALTPLYQRDDVSALSNFTARFAPQLGKMAMGEVDPSTRVAAIHVLAEVHERGLLEDEVADKVLRLVFCEDRKARVAIAPFFGKVMTERVEELINELEAEQSTPKKAAGKKGGKAKAKEPEPAAPAGEEEDKEVEETRVKLKVLVQMLVEFGKALDAADEDINPTQADEDDDESQAALVGAAATGGIVQTHTSRVAHAVEALWKDVPAVQEWEELAHFLLLDHSESSLVVPDVGGSGDAEMDLGTKKLAKEAYRLDEEEETVAIEILAASIERTVKIASVSFSHKKDTDVEDDVKAEITRTMINALPKLFAKHQTVPGRVVDLLAIPAFMKLELYLELRMITAYESLWDDVIKQFLNHAHADVIDKAVQTISKLTAEPTLTGTNTTKMTSLEEDLLQSLRDAIAGQDMEDANLGEDDVRTLTAVLARIERLQKSTTLVVALDEEVDGFAALSLLDQISERGRLGYAAEEQLVQHALSIVSLNLVWKLVGAQVSVKKGKDASPAALFALRDRRQLITDRLEEFAIGEASNAVDGVKQTALSNLIDVLIVLKSVQIRDTEKALADIYFEAGDELQSRAAGFMQSEIERYVAANESAECDKEEDEEDEEGSEDEAPKKSKGKGKAKPANGAVKSKRVPTKSIKALQAQQSFELLVSRFTKALTAEVLNIEHAPVLLAYCGRLGPLADQGVKQVSQTLRQAWMHQSQLDLVAKLVITSLEEAFETFLGSSKSTDESVIALARMMSSTIVVRGNQLAIVKRMPRPQIVRIHKSLAEYLVKKTANFAEAKKKESKDRALSLFKTLTILLLGCDGKDALEIKQALEAALEAKELEVAATAKSWEPLRSFQKRLMNIMSKDTGLKAAAKAKAAKKQEAEANGADSDEDIEDAEPAEKAPPKKPLRGFVPKGKGKGKAAAALDWAASDDEDEAVAVPVPGPALKKSKAGLNGLARDSPAAFDEVEDDDDEVQDLLLGSTHGSSQKRARSEEDAHDPAEDAEVDLEEDDDDENDDAASVMSLSDMKRASKRVKV